MSFFPHSEGTTVNGGTFFGISGSGNVVNAAPDPRKGEGIKLLRKSYIQREAIHDSDSRGALGCHPGTREEYIRNITTWGKGQWESEKRAFLMTGPAGAGKSAIARTCAYKLKAAGNLGASFFFYRPSRWNDPKKFIPTIAYQLATRYSAYRDCIDAVILDDPLVLEKVIDVQFLELLVKPLLQPSVNGHNVDADLVIVVDGLDECATVDAQLQIINLITTSIHEHTTPFLWAIFSRPEPRITSDFSKTATNISWTLPLTLSGNVESDIDAYLRGSFQVIRTKHNIPPSEMWPKEEEVRQLVCQSAELFVYAATAIRYIDGVSNEGAGPDVRLGAVLQVYLPSREHPFSALDQLYKLLMMQIPEGVLPHTLSLLRIDQTPTYQRFAISNDYQQSKVAAYCSALGISSTGFHVAIGNLYSVLEVTESRDEKPAFQFYHKSFFDFLAEETRSGRYCITSTGAHQRCLEMVLGVLNRELNQTVSGGLPLQAFFVLVEEYKELLKSNILDQILRVDWKSWHDDNYGSKFQIDFPQFFKRVWLRPLVM